MNKIFFAIMSMPFLFIQCDITSYKNNDPLPFEWVEEGHELWYRYRSFVDTTQFSFSTYKGEILDSALVLKVELNPTENLRINYYYPIWNGDCNYNRAGRNFNVYRRSAGLYTSAYVDCLGGWGIIESTFEYIRVPSDPLAGDICPDYLCKDEVLTGYQVVNVDTIITVPLGNFKTFVLKDTSTFRKEYWSEKDGLIKIETCSSTGDPLVSYELRSRNFNE